MGDHRAALGEEDCGQEVANLALAQLQDRLILAVALDAGVPGAVVVAAVLVVLPVGVVVLLVVGDEVPEREAVVAGDEVDAGRGSAAVALVEVGGAGQPVGEVADPAGLAAPVVADGVPEAPVPFCPADREVADLVAALPDVPRLGHQLHLGEDRVLVDDLEEG